MPGFDTLLPRPVSVSAAPGSCPWPAPVSVRTAPELPAEGYRLEITPEGVTLFAADAAAEVYGRQTLRQLAGPDAFRAASIHSGLTLPCG
ncbi:MAG TPA: glycoside hydrolase family 20 zincin-like fold domain-containing protein, partial [Amycolatopsis sp.]